MSDLRTKCEFGCSARGPRAFYAYVSFLEYLLRRIPNVLPRPRSKAHRGEPTRWLKRLVKPLWRLTMILVLIITYR